MIAFISLLIGAVIGFSWLFSQFIKDLEKCEREFKNENHD